MNNHQVIDYARMGENYIADDGGIESAIQKIDMPVYVICRHGVYKRFLSRSAAVDNLARIMASEVYRRHGWEIRSEGQYSAERQAWMLGDLRQEYIRCRDRAKRRILRLLAKRREIDNWNNDYRKWIDKCEKSREELYKRKPY